MAFVPNVSTVLKSGLSHVCAAGCATSVVGGRTKKDAILYGTTTSESVAGGKRGGAVRRQNVTMMASAQRKFMIGGNWKCNMSKATISELVSAFNAAPALDSSAVEVVVAPPSVYLESTRAALRADFATGSQNTWLGAGGAYTGEVDAKMVSDVGSTWAIVGHSERRHIPQIHESDADIATKAAYAIREAGLGAIFCIGELLEQRESGDTVAVCERQLQALLDAIGSDETHWRNIVIAYEPVWAIGTGKVATPEQAEQVHSSVRQWLATHVSQHVADSTRILYGGSVSPANCQDLAKKPNVDGFLVGGASLKPTFLEIIDSYKAALTSAV